MSFFDDDLPSSGSNILGNPVTLVMIVMIALSNRFGLSAIHDINNVDLGTFEDDGVVMLEEFQERILEGYGDV